VPHLCQARACHTYISPVIIIKWLNGSLITWLSSSVSSRQCVDLVCFVHAILSNFSKTFAAYGACRVGVSLIPDDWMTVDTVSLVQVGRPANMPQCQPVIERLKEESSKYNRIYVSSIHLDLNDNDLRTSVSSILLQHLFDFELFAVKIFATDTELISTQCCCCHCGHRYKDYE